MFVAALQMVSTPSVANKTAVCRSQLPAVQHRSL